MASSGCCRRPAANAQQAAPGGGHVLVRSNSRLSCLKRSNSGSLAAAGVKSNEGQGLQGQALDIARDLGILGNIFRAPQGPAGVEIIRGMMHVNEKKWLETHATAGGNILHMAVLLGKTDIAVYLANTYPQLVLETYQSKGLYDGECSLHLAIARGNLDLLQLFLSIMKTHNAFGLLHQRAMGSFFRGEKATAPYGEYPLSFAVATNQGRMVSALVDAGARLDAIDKDGNTCLHIAVIFAPHDHSPRPAFDVEDTKGGTKQSLINEFPIVDLLLELWERETTRPKGAGGEARRHTCPVHLRYVPNAAGHTALTLAVQLGKMKLFQYLWKKQEKVRDPLLTNGTRGQGAVGPSSELQAADGEAGDVRAGYAAIKHWGWGNAVGWLLPLREIDDVDEAAAGLALEAAASAAVRAQAEPVTPGKRATDAMNTAAATFTTISLLLRTLSRGAALEPSSGDREPADQSEVQPYSDDYYSKPRFVGKKHVSVRRLNVLEIIAGDDAHAEKLAGALWRLVERKWNHGADGHFARALTYYAAYLVCLSVFALIPGNAGAAALECGYPYTCDVSDAVFGIVKVIGGIGALLYTLQRAYAIVCEIAITARQGLQSGADFPTRTHHFVTGIGRGIKQFFSLKGKGSTSLDHYTSLSIVVFVTATAACMTCGLSSSESCPNAPWWTSLWLALTLIISWMRSFFFMVGWEYTGPFVVTLYRIIATDMVRYALLSFSVLFGFMTAFAVLGTAPGLDGLFPQPRQALVALWKDFDHDPTKEFSALVPFEIGFAVLASVLLNLLIAMMNDTYAKTLEKANAQWRLERLRILLLMEQGMAVEEKTRKWVKESAGKEEPYFFDIEKDDEAYFTEERHLQALEALWHVRNAPAPPATGNDGAHGVRLVPAPGAAGQAAAAAGAGTGLPAYVAYPVDPPHPSSALAGAAFGAATGATAAGAGAAHGRSVGTITLPSTPSAGAASASSGAAASATNEGGADENADASTAKRRKGGVKGRAGSVAPKSRAGAAATLSVGEEDTQAHTENRSSRLSRAAAKGR